MDYKYLTVEQQKAMAEERVHGLEREHYANLLAMQAAEAVAAKLPKKDIEGRSAVDERIALLTSNRLLIETAHVAAKAAVAELEKGKR